MLVWSIAAGSFCLAFLLWRLLQHKSGVQIYVPKLVARLAGGLDGVASLEPLVATLTVCGLVVSDVTGTIDCLGRVPEAGRRHTDLHSAAVLDPARRDKTYSDCAAHGMRIVRSLLVSLAVSVAQFLAPLVWRLCSHWLLASTCPPVPPTDSTPLRRTQGWSFSLPVQLSAVNMRLHHPSLPGCTADLQASDVRLAVAVNLSDSPSLQLSIQWKSARVQAPARDETTSAVLSCDMAGPCLRSTGACCVASITIPLARVCDVTQMMSSIGQTAHCIDVQCDVGAVNCCLQDILAWSRQRSMQEGVDEPVSTSSSVNTECTGVSTLGEEQAVLQPAAERADTTAPQWLIQVLNVLECYAASHDGLTALRSSAVSAFRGGLAALADRDRTPFAATLSIAQQKAHMQTAASDDMSLDIAVIQTQCTRSALGDVRVQALSMDMAWQAQQYRLTVEARQLHAGTGGGATHQQGSSHAVEWHGHTHVPLQCWLESITCSVHGGPTEAVGSRREEMLGADRQDPQHKLAWLRMQPVQQRQDSPLGSEMPHPFFSLRTGAIHGGVCPGAWVACHTLWRNGQHLQACLASISRQTITEQTGASEVPRPLGPVMLYVSTVSLAFQPNPAEYWRPHAQSDPRLGHHAATLAEGYLQVLASEMGSLHIQLEGLQASSFPSLSYTFACGGAALYVSAHDTGLLLARGGTLCLDRQAALAELDCPEMMVGLYRHGNVCEALAGLSTCCPPHPQGLITVLSEMESTAWPDTAVARRAVTLRGEKRRHTATNYSIAAKRVPFSLRVRELCASVQLPSPARPIPAITCTSHVGSMQGLVAVEGAPVMVHRAQQVAQTLHILRQSWQCWAVHALPTPTLEARPSSTGAGGDETDDDDVRACSEPQPSLIAQALQSAFAECETGAHYFAAPLPDRQAEGAPGLIAVSREDTYTNQHESIKKRSAGMHTAFEAPSTGNSSSADSPWWHSRLSIQCDVFSLCLSDRGQGAPQFAPGRLVNDYGAERRKMKGKGTGKRRGSISRAAAADSMEELSSSPERSSSLRTQDHGTRRTDAAQATGTGGVSARARHAELGRAGVSIEDDTSSGDEESDMPLRVSLRGDTPGRAAGTIEWRTHGLWMNAEQRSSDLTPLSQSLTDATEAQAVAVLRIRAGAASVTAVELLDVAPPLHFDGSEGAIVPEPVPLLRIMPHAAQKKRNVTTSSRDAVPSGLSPLLSGGEGGRDRQASGQATSEADPDPATRGSTVTARGMKSAGQSSRDETETRRSSQQGPPSVVMQNGSVLHSATAAVGDSGCQSTPAQQALCIEFTRTGWYIPPSILAWQEVLVEEAKARGDKGRSGRLADQRQKDVCIRRDYEAQVQRTVLRSVALPLQEEGSRSSAAEPLALATPGDSAGSAKAVPSACTTVPGVSWMAFDHVDETGAYALLRPLVANGLSGREEGRAVAGQPVDAVRVSMGVMHAHLRGRAVAWARALQASDLVRDVLALSSTAATHDAGTGTLAPAGRCVQVHMPLQHGAPRPYHQTGCTGAKAALAWQPPQLSRQDAVSPTSSTSRASTRGISRVSLPLNTEPDEMMGGGRAGRVNGRMFTGGAEEEAEEWENAAMDWDCSNMAVTGTACAHPGQCTMRGAAGQALQPLVISIDVVLHNPALPPSASSCLLLSFDPECGINTLPLGVANTVAAWVTQQGEKVLGFLRELAPAVAEPFLQAGQGVGGQGLITRLLQPGIAVQLPPMRGLRLSIPSTLLIPYPGTWLMGCSHMERAVRLHAGDMLNQASEAAHNTGAIDPTVASLARQAQQGLEGPLRSAGDALQSLLGGGGADRGGPVGAGQEHAHLLHHAVAVASVGTRGLSDTLRHSVRKAAPVVATATAHGASAVAAAAAGAATVVGRPLWARLSALLAPPSPSPAAPQPCSARRIGGEGTASAERVSVRELGVEDGGFILLGMGPVDSARPSAVQGTVPPLPPHRMPSTAYGPPAGDLETVQLVPLPQSGASPRSTQRSASTYNVASVNELEGARMRGAQDMDETMASFNP